ncbi:MAG: diguanylate cyclase, partial [Spirochaetota bacterium]
MIKEKDPVEIAPGIFRIVSGTSPGCTTYLIIDNEQGILIDPGSVLDFNGVSGKVRSLIAFAKITHIILHNHDADCCSSVPLFEQAGVAAKTAFHWRTSRIVRHFGISSAGYIVNEHSFMLSLASGRVLYFIPTPYLHCAGSIATYDEKSKILFSGSLFGSFRQSPDAWADAAYTEAMKSFHEHYMPSNDIIRPAMDRFLEMNIGMIAPQHGPVIRENIRENIAALRDLECGNDMEPARGQPGGSIYGSICAAVLARYEAEFSKDEVRKIFENSKIPFLEGFADIAKRGELGPGAWDSLFEIIAAEKGTQWLFPVEPMVRRLCGEYGIPLPKVFSAALAYSGNRYLQLFESRGKTSADTKSGMLQIRETEKSLICHSLTGLYNDAFFKSFLEKEITARQGGSDGFFILFIAVDNLVQINNKLGKKAGNEILIHFTYLLKNFIASRESSFPIMPFKAEGPWFAVFVPENAPEKALEIADGIRVAVAQSSLFITNITVSAGIVGMNEFASPAKSAAETAGIIYDAGMMKGRIAQKQGPGSIYYRTDIADESSFEDFVLIADTDTMNLGILKKEFSDLGFSSITCEDGAEVLSIIEQRTPMAVICELMMPKTDAFRIKDQMNRSSRTKDLPFILLA